METLSLAIVMSHDKSICIVLAYKDPTVKCILFLLLL
jgi:hypothetical protein